MVCREGGACNRYCGRYGIPVTNYPNPRAVISVFSLFFFLFFFSRSSSSLLDHPGIRVFWLAGGGGGREGGRWEEGIGKRGRGKGKGKGKACESR